MKRIFQFVALFVLLSIFLILSLSAKDKDSTSNPQKSQNIPDKELEPGTTTERKYFDYDGVAYEYFVRKINSDENIYLIPNFESRKSSGEIREENSCTFGINGGFYQASGQPLGLFFADSKYFGNHVTSNTFDGFVVKKKYEPKAVIMGPGDDIDRLLGDLGDFEFIMQSGPYYDLVGQDSWEYADREYARRHLLASDKFGNIFLFSIFTKENKYSGPRLSDIPQLFKKTNIGDIATFVNILNLDGGTASAFFDGQNNAKVNELQPIGSYLCGN